jgi:flavorubredoxin
MSGQHNGSIDCYAPEAPTERHAPEKIAKDTWLIRQVQHAFGAPLCVYINSMVINGAEPIIVDTGSAANRGQWLEDVFGIVEPRDVSWVFLSHDDADHTGNLAEVLARCPNARLVCSWPLVERFSNALRFPIARCRWLNDGEQFAAGDRQLRAVRPPVYDSPTSRGLFDETTGVYWAVDAFATPMPERAVANVAELDPTFWREGHAMFCHHALSPWLELVDAKRYHASVDHVRALGMTTIAAAHTPIIGETSIAAAFELMRHLPDTPVPPCPDHTMLEAVLQAAGS